jgi:hypothetical protein
VAAPTVPRTPAAAAPAAATVRADPASLIGVGCFVAALVLYLATAKPDLVGGDPGEFQFVTWVLGIAHHTGYPLFTIVGWAWSQLPIGSVAYRMNLFSAVWGAAAVGLGAALTTRLARMPLGWLSGVVAGVALAVAPLPWHWATIAGVRSGAVAEVGWMLLATASLLGAIDARRLSWLGVAVGVALAHHRSGALALPGIAATLVTVGSVWRVGLKAWLIVAGLGLVPLLSYLYLPLRAQQGPPFHQWHPETWDGFWDLALALEHSRVHFAFPLSAMPGRAGLLYQHLRGEFGSLGLLLAAIGCLWLLVRWPRAWLALAGFFVLQSWQVLNWDVGPDQLNLVYQLPAHLVVAIWLGLGVAAFADGVAFATGGRGQAAALREPGGAASGVGAAAMAVAAVAVVGWLGLRGMRELDAQRARAIAPINHDRSVLADGWAARRIVGGGLARVEPNAVVVGDWEQATVAWYLQLVEGQAPNVQVNYPVTNLPFTLKDFSDRPIWLMARTAVPDDRRLSGDGPFVHVTTKERFAVAPPADAAPAAGRFEDSLELVAIAYADRMGARVTSPDRGGDVLPITLYWRALGPTRRDLSISVRLITPDGRIAAQQDNAAPVLSLYPTSRWAEGEVVGDYYELPYRSLPPGDYRLEVRVYLVDGGFRDLRVGASDHADVATVTR